MASTSPGSGQICATGSSGRGRRCFQGPIPVGAGFIVSAAEADAQNDRDLVARLTDLNRQISTGERPYQPFD
jgi:hypothetical protein